MAIFKKPGMQVPNSTYPAAPSGGDANMGSTEPPDFRAPVATPPDSEETYPNPVSGVGDQGLWDRLMSNPEIMKRLSALSAPQQQSQPSPYAAPQIPGQNDVQGATGRIMQAAGSGPGPSSGVLPGYLQDDYSKSRGRRMRGY